MLLGLASVSVLGGVLHEQIARGLESDHVEASEYDALALTARAQSQWDNSTSTSVDELDQAAFDIMSRILSPPPGPDPTRYVVMTRSAGNESDIVLAERSSGALDISAVSDQLQAAVAANPIGENTALGHYTNFVNLLDLCALTMPVGPPLPDHPPVSLTLIAPAWADRTLAALAGRLADGGASATVV